MITHPSVFAVASPPATGPPPQETVTWTPNPAYFYVDPEKMQWTTNPPTQPPHQMRGPPHTMVATQPQPLPTNYSPILVSPANPPLMQPNHPAPVTYTLAPGPTTWMQAPPPGLGHPGPTVIHPQQQPAPQAFTLMTTPPQFVNHPSLTNNSILEKGQPQQVLVKQQQQQQRQQTAVPLIIRGPPPTRQGIDRSKRKTRMCSYWLQNGSCGWGDECAFAHGEGELARTTH